MKCSRVLAQEPLSSSNPPSNAQIQLMKQNENIKKPAVTSFKLGPEFHHRPGALKAVRRSSKSGHHGCNNFRIRWSFRYLLSTDHPNAQIGQEPTYPCDPFQPGRLPVEVLAFRQIHSRSRART